MGEMIHNFCNPLDNLPPPPPSKDNLALDNLGCLAEVAAQCLQRRPTLLLVCGLRAQGEGVRNQRCRCTCFPQYDGTHKTS